MNTVCVFAGSSLGARKEFAAAARMLGEAIATRGARLVFGGASVGLMGEVADAALASGGDVIGVLPEYLQRVELVHTNLTELIIVDSMHTRKSTMADYADAFIALPGGLGSLEELFEVWTWTQLGLHRKPLGLLNVQGYYDDLLGFLDHTVSEGFVKSVHRDILQADESPETLLTLLESTALPDEGKWIN
ncbi:MAG: TIGR00730 family Rossman fold protein [Pseudomonadales bacterium]|nr:TIGR00730 family Rossman fold protein [Pseudomonadales bacterium]